MNLRKSQQIFSKVPFNAKSNVDNPFHKLILHPKNVAHTRADKQLGNPTPIALAGFLISLSQLSCDFMGFRGAGTSGAAATASYIIFGGVLQLLGGVLEWSLGHTFSSVVFCTFGAFYLSTGLDFIPSLNSWGSFAPDGSPAVAGLANPAYNASAGFFPLWMGVLCFVYMVAALRTNICFVVIFFFLVVGLCLKTASVWLLAIDYTGYSDPAKRLNTATGAMFFVSAMVGWYVWTSAILAAVDFPMQIPIGDLSHVIRGRSETREKSESSKA
ncbi:hypothetical protein GQ53DRAFT_869855 [Thozetella sp. PMI_491]|nr:hypothetical protein GQ53DRAFT_869855 [Thozetella sp. PMI_491]